MTTPMLVCGHAAHARDGDGNPCCVICAGTPGSRIVAEPPDLTGRMARCSQGCEERPSSSDLAFFEYWGPGSPQAERHCKSCGMFDFVHQEINPSTGRAGRLDHPFVPRGDRGYDSYYCGCRGWD